MADDDKSRPEVTIPPAGSSEPKMSERTLRTTLGSIEAAQHAQLLLETERMGAAKFRTKLFALFGGLITAAALAGFTWVWTVQASTTSHETRIDTLETNPAEDHGHAAIDGDVEAAEAAIEEVDDRVDAADAATKAINTRLDRMEREATTRHETVLGELRRLRARPRTWGGGQP